MFVVKSNKETSQVTKEKILSVGLNTDILKAKHYKQK